MKKNTIYLIALISFGIATIQSCRKEEPKVEECKTVECTKKTWFADQDSDGYGDPNNSQESCTKPTGYILDNTDCDDSNALNHPGAPEDTTDGVDNNCNGLFDECISGVQTLIECSCTDGIDNDWDGDVDAADSDC